MTEEIKKWEYQTEYINYTLSDEDLNQYGEKGWELVSAVMANGAFYYCFKRELKP